MPPEPCIYEAKIAEISTNLNNLKDSFNEFKTNDFHEVKTSVSRIINKMQEPRPTWAMLWLIAFLGSAVTSLLVLLLKK